MNDPLLRRLCEHAGIESGYRDTWGNTHEVSEAALRALLRALDFPADTHDEMEASLARMVDSSNDQLPPIDSATRAWRPAALADAGRRWGLAVQLYGLRTAHTWGIGDFSALAELMRGAAALGASAVGINPVHALFPNRPEHASPYSPSSRRFINPLYIDVGAVEDFASCSAARNVVESDDFRARLRGIRAADRVQYGAVTELKHAILATLYRSFRKSCLEPAEHPRGRAFRQFQLREGAGLRHFATFHTLTESRPEVDWRQWPVELRDPDSAAVTAFAAQHLEAIEFHEYLQWQAALQLDKVKETAHACGMSIGLYADLAVGADPVGAECWSGQSCLAQGATIGAPPDALNLSGQDWGLPPPDPFALKRVACAPLAGVWRSNMRCAGALRIDHAMGLMRLFWIPSATPAADGAYVRYPWRDLMGLLAAESQRSRCMVIGEDLGTVPDGLREAMRSMGMLAYRLLYFEQQDGRFRAPSEYPADALVAAGTHDLPPLPMWWHGEDIELRAQLGLWPNDEMRRDEIGRRQKARSALSAVLQQQGLDDGRTPGEVPTEAIHAYLARTPCKLLMVQIEDVLGLHSPVNLPGTTDQYPNWRQRLPCSVNEVLAHPRMRRIAAILEEQERGDR